jgi:hypothetical protein
MKVYTVKVYTVPVADEGFFPGGRIRWCLEDEYGSLVRVTRDGISWLVSADTETEVAKLGTASGFNVVA